MLSRLDEIKLQCYNPIELLKMIVLRDDCWHKKIEDLVGSPLEPPAIDLTICGDTCPFCCDMITNYIISISRAGLSQFLADVFINNPGGELSPVLLVKKLTEYKDAGIFYGRPRRKKALPGNYVSVTILRLMTSELTQLNFDYNNNEC